MVFILSLFISFTSFSQIKLPKLISDGMVLQRNTNIKIWGWASAGEKVSIQFIDKEYNTTTDSKGDWSVSIQTQKAGGPYEMIINASNKITIHDIMIGDVWICSGQSNMEHSLGSFDWVYKKEIENSTNKYIRQFLVPQKYNFNTPQTDLESGSWKSANPKNVKNFSAVAYFFGKEIYDKYKVPIGLINSSLGGSPVESWISEDALKSFPAYYNEAQFI